MADYLKRISVDPNVCHGEPCIARTRVLVAVVLDSLAEGATPEEVVAEYPPLTLEDVGACIEYSAHPDRAEEITAPGT